MDKTKKGFAVASALFIVSLFFDKPAALFFAAHRTVALNILFTAVTHIGTFIALLFLALSFYFWYADRKRLIMPLWLGLGAAMAIAYVLKHIVGRARPFAALPITALTSETPDTSFPSGHATAAFSALPIIRGESKTLGYLWTAFAGLIAFSRIYLGLHYISDVIFGAMLGYAVAMLFAAAKDSSWGRKLDIFEGKKWIR